MITLWGRSTSINVQKVMWLLAELKVQYTRIDCGGAFGGLDDPAYVALNPNRTVPTLVDGDVVIWESNAILRYLAGTYGPKTSFGGTPAQRALGDNWMEWYQTSVYARFQAIFHQTVRLPMADRDAGILAGAVAVVDQKFQLIESVLQTRPCIAGDHLTLGDIPMAASLYRYYTMDIERPQLPAIERYYQRLTQHPPYRDNVMISYESLRAKT